MALVVAGLLPVAMFVPASSARLADRAPERPAGPPSGPRATRRLRYRAHGEQGLVHAQRREVTDVYYPRIDTPSLRDSQFVVTDGKTFTDREDRDSKHEVSLLSADSLTYRVVNTAKSGDWRITKTFVTDPSRSRRRRARKFVSLTGGPPGVRAARPRAVDDRQRRHRGHQARRQLAAPSRRHERECRGSGAGLGKTSSGYLGVSDGWTDLSTDHRMDWSVRRPEARQRGADRPDDPLRTARSAAPDAGGRLRHRLRRGRGRGAGVVAQRLRGRCPRSTPPGGALPEQAGSDPEERAALAHDVSRLGKWSSPPARTRRTEAAS